ncbi:asparagine synthase [Bifidobacterium hapali]|uniref:Asparagine synthase n=1 Tax=Bifidobacterium hapali TaxID=1630172 RepID=A0A261G1L2_9BIFI|nr:asparagine synthase [Bifidobacterium hapali]
MMPFTYKNPNRTVIVRGGKPTDCSKLPASISINDEGTCVQVPLLSGDRMFWIVSEDEVLLSDSASRLASITNADLDLERIVMDLLPSLPDSLRGDKSPWRNVHSIPVATILHLDKSNRPRYTRAEPSPIKHVSNGAILASLRSSFLTIADEWRNEALLSADVSGGVDSAAITYIFASEGFVCPCIMKHPTIQ